MHINFLFGILNHGAGSDARSRSDSRGGAMRECVISGRGGRVSEMYLSPSGWGEFTACSYFGLHLDLTDELNQTARLNQSTINFWRDETRSNSIGNQTTCGIGRDMRRKPDYEAKGYGPRQRFTDEIQT